MLHYLAVSLLDSFFPKLAATLASPVKDAAPAAFEFKIPASLPKLAPLAETGADDSAARLSALLKERKAPEAIDLLAKQLPEQDAVRWAGDSCDVVSEKLTPKDKAALDSCKAWLAEPGLTNKSLAGAAAAKAGHGGPGAWAAQAAAWAKTLGEPKPLPNHPALLAQAVAGSVMLAAALTQPGVTLPKPDDGTLTPANLPAFPNKPSAPSSPVPVAAPNPPPAADLCRLYKPFLDKGIAIAAGG